MHRIIVVVICSFFMPGLAKAQESAEVPPQDLYASTAVDVTASLYGQLPVDAIAMMCQMGMACQTPSQALVAASRLATVDAPFAVVPTDRVPFFEGIAAEPGLDYAEKIQALESYAYVYRGDFCAECECCIVKQNDTLDLPDATRSPMIVPDGFTVLDLRP